MQTRRQTLKQGAAVAGLLAGAVMLPAPALAFNKDAFGSSEIERALKALGVSGELTESGDVGLKAPDIAENGAVVPMTVSSSIDNLKQLALVVENNPAPLVAVFDVSPEVEADFATRAKMGQSSDVYAIAITSDGKAFYTKKEVKVTLGGCGG